MKEALQQSSSKFDISFTSWCRLWNELGCASSPKSLYKQLVKAYSEPMRQYHTLTHLEECMAYLSEVGSLCSQQAEVGIALWFHDAIYNPQQADNELQSAKWAEQATQEQGASQLVSQRIRNLVLATQHQVQPTEKDAQILSDIDLSILGASEDRFSEYEFQVREEYSWVPDAQFSAGRQHILETLLSRGSIYCTEYFRDLLEEKAQANIKRSLACLRAS
jgi:predicted metal-dependent HD superfamily phosphohydrolase